MTVLKFVIKPDVNIINILHLPYSTNVITPLKKRYTHTVNTKLKGRVEITLNYCFFSI